MSNPLMETLRSFTSKSKTWFANFLVLTQEFKPLLGIGPIFITLLTAAGGAFVIWKKWGGQPYPDFVVGFCTWTAVSKACDYRAAMAFIALFLLGVLVLNELFRRITQAGKNLAVLEALNQLFLVACIPAGWAIGAHLVHLDFNAAVNYLALSAGAALLLAFSGLGLIRHAAHLEKQSVVNILGSTLLAFLFTAFAIWAFSLVLARPSLFLHEFFMPFKMKRVLWLGLLLLSSVLVFIYLHSKTLLQLEKRLLNLVLWLQAPLPLLLLVFIPSPWQIDGRVFRGNVTTPAFQAVLWSLIAIGFFVWWRKQQKFRHEPTQPMRLEKILVPVSFLFLLIYIHVPVFGVPMVSPDDYHLGEVLLPWQQWFQFGKLPFIDLNYPHGFGDLLRGFFSWFFYDNTAASFPMVGTLLAICVLAMTYGAIAGQFGPLLAFFFVYTFINADLISPEFTLPVFLVLLLKPLLDRPIRWLILACLLLPCALLFRLSYGSATLIAVFPLFAWMVVKAWQQQKSLFLKWGGVFFASTVLILLLTPALKMGIQILHYLKENASLNTLSYGIPLAPFICQIPEYFKTGSLLASPLLWETLRFSWLVVLALLLWLVWKTWTQPERSQKTIALLYGLSLILFLVAIFAYSLGRIDPAITRTGRISLWVLMFAFPLFLLFLNKTKTVTYLVVIYPLLAGLGFSTLYGPLPSLVDLPSKAFSETLPPAGFEAAVATRAELPRLGRSQVDPNHWAGLQELNNALKQQLKPGETYYDMTNHTARYYYLDYPIPVCEGAFFNAPGQATQLKMIGQLQANRVPLILINGQNINHDGVRSSLRVPLVYEYVVEHYVPVQMGQYTFLTDPARIPASQATTETATQTLTEAQFTLLDQVFRQDHLGRLPIAWGQSWKTLAPRLKKTAALTLLPESNPACTLRAQNPRASWALQGDNLLGKNMPFLILNVEQTPTPADCEIRITWTAQETALPAEKNSTVCFIRKGVNIIPLFAYPRWLLLHPQTLDFEAINLPTGGSLTVSTVQFFKRK